MHSMSKTQLYCRVPNLLCSVAQAWSMLRFAVIVLHAASCWLDCVPQGLHKLRLAIVLSRKHSSLQKQQSAAQHDPSVAACGFVHLVICCSTLYRVHGLLQPAKNSCQGLRHPFQLCWRDLGCSVCKLFHENGYDYRCLVSGCP